MRVLCMLVAMSVPLVGSPAFAGDAWTGDGLPASTGVLGPVLAQATQEPAQSPDAVPGPDAAQSPEAAQLDARIRALTEKQRRISLGGPIVATSVGGGMVILGGTVAAAAAISCHDAENSSNKKCNHSAADGLIIAGAAVAGVGVVTAIAGAVTLVRRRNERRAIGREILDTRHNKESLLKSVGYHLDVTGGREMLTMRVEF